MVEMALTNSRYLRQYGGITILALVIVCVIIYKIHSEKQHYKRQYRYYEKLYRDEVLREIVFDDEDDLSDLSARLVHQRDFLSRQLNLNQQKLSQMECKKGGSKGSVSSSGGWCQEISTENAGQHMTDTVLAKALADLFQGKYVASFGDGPGRYKQLIESTGKVKGYDAFDGAPFSEKTSNDRVQFLDLTLPQYGLKLYDWVVSLEVGEHIPNEFEPIFIDNLVRHAREGIVLSWAPPEQGGYSHVNCQSLEYLQGLFQKLKFQYDDPASKLLRNASTFEWFQTNIIVFRRKTEKGLKKVEKYYA